MNLKWLFSLPFLLIHTPEFRQQDVEVARGPVVDPCYSESLAFGHGEEVVYKLYYNWNFVWLPAGEVIFRTREYSDDFHISAVGKTYPSYEWFFKVKDHYQSIVDKQTLLPKVFIRDIQEGNFKLYNKIVFDQKAGKAVSYKGPQKDDVKIDEYGMDNCMHDMLSIIYFLRNVEFGSLKPKDEFPIRIFLDGEAWNLNVSYLGKKKNVSVKDGGTYNTVLFSPEVIAGNQFKEGTRMSVWVSDDNNRVPVLVESPVSVGSIKAVLKSYKGLRHPFAAKVK